jgi:hypothetical protein
VDVAFQGELNLIRDLPRDLALQRQEILQLAIILASPHVRLVLRLDELGRDSDVVGVPADAPFDDVLHAELAPDLIQRRLAALVTHHGSARDHSQVPGIEISDLHDHFFGQSVAEIVLAGIAGEVLKREDGEHDPCGGRLRDRGAGPHGPCREGRGDENG